MLCSEDRSKQRKSLLHFGSQPLLISYSNLLNPFGLTGPQKSSGNFSTIKHLHSSSSGSTCEVEQNLWDMQEASWDSL